MTVTLAAELLDDDQLHGRTCRRGPAGCRGELLPDGHVYTEPAEPGAPLGWAVVACLAHREAA
jgi:hypothetical protein